MEGPKSAFLGARAIIAELAFSLPADLFIPLTFLFVLFLFRALLRKEWAAAVACVLFFSVFLALGGTDIPINFTRWLIVTGLSVFLLIRFGLLALVAQGFFYGPLSNIFPLTTQMSSWYAGISLAGILLMAAMALYGFYTSLGGRPVLGSAVFEE
jgi:hypothetical protein